MAVQTKICGLKTEAAVRAAVEGGAAMLGFVFFPPSPRNVSMEAARELMALAPAGVKTVALMVDPDDDALRAIAALPVDMVQLHGHETPARVTEAKALTGKAVMKAVAIGGPDDVTRARDFEAVADMVLFDARPPVGATRPGGNAEAFDWSLLAGTSWAVPWLLAGGLTADTVARAVAESGAEMVDVSSGVESAPGEKNVDEIRRFLAVTETL